MASRKKGRPGYVQIHVAWFTTRDGRRIYARNYGKQSFTFWVKAK